MIMNIKLTDVCDILYGYPFDSSKFNSNNGIGVVRIRDIVRGYTETFTTEDCSEQYAVKKGDILVGMDGEFNIAKWQGAPAMLNQRVCKLSPKANLDKNYLFYYMPIILKSIEARTPFVTVKHLSAKELNNVYLQLPSIEEQRKIALVLSTIDLLIGNYYTQLQDLGNLVKSRFIEMFGNISNSKFPTKKIGDVCVLKSGTTFPKNVEENHGFYIYAKVSDMTLEGNSKYIKNSKKHVSFDIGKKSFIPKGSVIFPKRGGAIGTNKKRILLYDTCVDLNIMGVTPGPELLTEFLYYYFDSIDMQTLCDGSTVPQINNKDIAPLEIGMPSITLQSQFADFVTQVDKSKLAVQQSLNELETLKKSLMQQYFG